MGKKLYYYIYVCTDCGEVERLTTMLGKTTRCGHCGYTKTFCSVEPVTMCGE